MTDEKLYLLCKHYGEIALKYRRKFLALLPEVYKRKLFEKKGFTSIFEFAAKLAGVSEEQVRRVLNTEERFSKMPILKGLLESGEVSVNKLAKIVSIATPENQEILANQVRLLSTRALETLVRDEKISKNENGFLKLENSDKFVHVNTNPSRNAENATGRFSNEINIGKPAFITISLSKGELLLDEKVGEKLLDLQNKRIDINKLLLEFLQERELKIAQEKEKLSTEINSAGSVNSRYIPKSIRQIIQEEHGTKCSISTCRRPAEVIHHSQRFSLARNHDPKYLAPLCKEHHRIAHSIDIKYQDMQPP